MLVIPAIDLRDGKCVRLKQGDYSQETIYSDFPWKMALDWANQGAQYLHLVDLDQTNQSGMMVLQKMKSAG